MWSFALLQQRYLLRGGQDSLGYPNEVQCLNLCILIHLQRFLLVRSGSCLSVLRRSITPYHVIALALPTVSTSWQVRPLFFPPCRCNNSSPCLVWNIETVTLHYTTLQNSVCVQCWGQSPLCAVPCDTFLPAPTILALTLNQNMPCLDYLTCLTTIIRGPGSAYTCWDTRWDGTKVQV